MRNPKESLIGRIASSETKFQTAWRIFGGGGVFGFGGWGEEVGETVGGLAHSPDFSSFSFSMSEVLIVYKL